MCEKNMQLENIIPTRKYVTYNTNYVLENIFITICAQIFSNVTLRTMHEKCFRTLK